MTLRKGDFAIIRSNTLTYHEEPINSRVQVIKVLNNIVIAQCGSGKWHYIAIDELEVGQSMRFAQVLTEYLENEFKQY